ncbi:MAG: hypothetical protein ISS15_05460 [Alphaproteobacteria bacterium]|nr:hypothetical protein [Alphaproteobacteria bacterium]MBL6939432.1 hypothetical protein [Alphaproteobacteria bacterium]MBL7097087.1 hypothetical protein [Alphaproteobacteria bacterium]
MALARRKPNSEHERRDTPKDATHDFHRSRPEAIDCLLSIERAALQRYRAICEGACGAGDLVRPLRRAGFDVVASDVIDRGCPNGIVADFLDPKAFARLPLPPRAAQRAFVSNPPFNLDDEFILAATQRFDYVAMLLRLRYLAPFHLIDAFGDGIKRAIWTSTRIPFARIVLPNHRWKTMHREGYTGPKTDSGTIDFCWFIWEQGHTGSPRILRQPPRGRQ